MSRILETVLGRIRRSAAGPNQVTDAELLTQFVRARDAAAFELLFWRHGPMIWGVCRRVLGNVPDAEDAFQATFVVLARKAHTIGASGALAAWLHRVAWRTALNARLARARRTDRESLPVVLPEQSVGPEPAEAAATHELQAIIDHELARLPEKYRRALILCDLESRSHAAAAADLGCPLGTLHSRLARGRAKLRSQLMRRGVMPAALAAVVVPPGMASAALAALARPPAEPIRILADGAIRALALATAKKAAAITVGCVLVAGIAFGTAGARDTPQVPAAPPAIVQIADGGPRFLDPDAGPLPPEAVARIGSPRLRHRGRIAGLAYSPDGKWLASVSTDPIDATARLWNAANGNEQLSAKITAAGRNATLAVQALGFTADSRQFLVADVSAIRTIDLETGREVSRHEFPGDARQNDSLPARIGAAISPDGRTLVIVGQDKFEIRDIASGAVRMSAESPFKRYQFVPVVFSSDSRRFALGISYERPMAIFDVDSAKQISQIQIDGKIVNQATFLSDGDTLVGRVADRQTRNGSLGFFDVKTGRLLRTTPIDDQSSSIAASPVEKLLVVGSVAGKSSLILDCATGKEVGRLPSTPSVTVLSFSPDGKRLAGASSSGYGIAVWDIAKRAYDPTAAVPNSFYGTTFSADGRGLILPGAGRPTVDWRTGEVTKRRADVGADPTLMLWTCLSPDGALYAVSELPGPIRLLDATSGREVRVLTGHTSGPIYRAFSGDGKRLVSCGFDKSIRVWDVATGREIAQFTPPELFGQDRPCLSFDGRIMAAAFSQNVGNHTMVMTWDVETRAQLARIEVPTKFFSSAAISPDGRFVAAGGGQENHRVEAPADVFIWNAVTGAKMHTLTGHQTSSIHPRAWCAFSRDSRILATGDVAGHLRLWEVSTGQQIHQFDGHRSDVTADFSPDGRLIVATSQEAPCFVWSVVDIQRGPANLADPDQLWRDLADADAAKAFQAIRRLVASPEFAVELIRKSLRPAVAEDRDRVEKLLRDLDSSSFTTREAATTELTKLADRIGPTLAKARAGASAEVRSRLDRITDNTKTSPERTREDRALQALELIGTPPAAAVLDELAGGAAEDRLTLAAVAERARLRRRDPG